MCSVGENRWLSRNRAQGPSLPLFLPSFLEILHSVSGPVWPCSASKAVLCGGKISGFQVIVVWVLILTLPLNKQLSGLGQDGCSSHRASVPSFVMIFSQRTVEFRKW